VGAPAEALQVAQVVVAAQQHVAAPAAVAAVGAALGHVRLAPEREAAVAARAGPDLDACLVMKHLAQTLERLPSPTMPDDKVFLITGASTGIGAATARQAAQAGYRLVLAARSEDKLRDLAAELGGDERALAVRCDVTEWDDQQALVQRALDAYGRLDVAFANAGFGGSRGFKSATPEEWKAMVLTNVYGAALTIRAAYDALVATKGHLLLTSSVAGRRPLPGSFYSVTKHAVTAMGEAARQDFNDTGVRVTLIEPGIVNTPFFDSPPRIEALQPDDIARAVLFAVSQPGHVDVNEILIRPTAQPG
jgi:NADP-dependent 3-hydroxy acid dehydrogenase YdfG